MKKSVFFIIGIVITLFSLCSCSQTFESSTYSENLQSSFVADESLTSENCSMVSRTFYKAEAYQDRDYSVNIKCESDDLEAELKAYFDELYSSKDETIYGGTWYTPIRIYAPFSKAVEKNDAENRLELKSIEVTENVIIYSYTYDGKDSIEFMFENPTVRFDFSDEKVQDKFIVPDEATGIELTLGSDNVCFLYNKVGDSILEYRYREDNKYTTEVNFLFEDWYCHIYIQSPYEADMPYFLFDEKQVTQFLANLREVADNETVDYAKLYGV